MADLNEAYNLLSDNVANIIDHYNKSCSTNITIEYIFDWWAINRNRNTDYPEVLGTVEKEVGSSIE